jgi:wyosine [tRNA(Phe)-imidazoG37] synthetase (radical SAM superfamily)
MKYKYLFGPVPSRRLGISLGVDIIPYKTCTLNCVYCECGATTNLTSERKEYVSVDQVIAELDDYLSQNPELDYITFSGGGEPTLHNGIGAVIDFINRKYPQYNIALLTNGTLFDRKGLRDEVAGADLIIPSLDAATPALFQKINRPAAELDLEKIIHGLTALRNEFDGEIWLEIFVVPGLNDQPKELAKIKEAIMQIMPDKVQLNTLDRPSTEDWVESATADELENILKFLDDENTEIVAKNISRKKISSFNQDIRDSIITTLKRRPCTAEDLSNILDLHLNEINKYLDTLLNEEIVTSEKKERGVFFKII